MLKLMKGDVHYHYDCPTCSEEAIPERCPAFRIEWTNTGGTGMADDSNAPKARLWYKDKTYMDIPIEQVNWYEHDPNWDHTEYPPVEEVNDDDDDR